MENTLLSSFVQKLKREAFKEKLLGRDCVMSIGKWIECIYEQECLCTANHGCDSADIERNSMQSKMLKQILDIMAKKRKNYLNSHLVGIEKLCDFIMQSNIELEDGWTEQNTCDRVINNLLQSLKYTIIRLRSLPALIAQLEVCAFNQQIFDVSIVVDCDNWENKILTVDRYRNFIYPNEGDDYLIERYELSAQEIYARKQKRFNRQFVNFLRDVRNDQLVGPLISLPKLVQVFKETSTSPAYTCDFTPWSTDIIDYACALLIETFEIAIMETDWNDVLLAKFMYPDDYDNVSFEDWHDTMFNIINPPSLLHLLYKDVPENEREQEHARQCEEFIARERDRFQSYEIERIEGAFAKLSDSRGKIIKLKKY